MTLQQRLLVVGSVPLVAFVGVTLARQFSELAEATDAPRTTGRRPATSPLATPRRGLTPVLATAATC